MCGDHKKEEYQHPCELPGRVRGHDIRKSGSNLVRMVVDHALFSDPSKKVFYDSLKEQERQRRLYGQDERYGVL